MDKTVRYTYEDIEPGVRQGRAEVVGYSKNPNGTMSRITRFEEYFKTKVGVYTLKDWTELAKSVIEDNGDKDLYKRILSYVEQLPWMKRAGQAETELYACECLTSGSYRHWENFS